MLTKKEIEKNKEAFIDLLNATKRPGIEKILEWLESSGFFTSPAATKFHGDFEGGLAAHSLGVYFALLHQHEKLSLGEATGAGQQPLEIKAENLVIACLLHDVCKAGAYKGSSSPYQWNKAHPKGHAKLSLEIAERFIALDPLEKLMIKYHMGPYGCNEFYDKDDWQQGEYPLRGDHSEDEKLSKEESKARRYGNSLANAWYHNPIVKMMYFCDELVTLEEKAD